MISPKRRKATEEDVDQEAAWEWFFEEVCTALGSGDEEDPTPSSKRRRELEFESLCDGALEDDL